MADIKHIESEYKKKMEAQVAVPPADMWSKIEASLIAKSNKKKLIIRWAIPAAVVIIGLLSIGVYVILPQKELLPNLSASAVPESQNNSESSQMPKRTVYSSGQADDKMINESVQPINSTTQTKNINRPNSNYTGATTNQPAKNEPIIKTTFLSIRNQPEKESPQKLPPADMPLLEHQHNSPLFEPQKVMTDKLQFTETQTNWIQKFNVNNSSDETIHTKNKQAVKVQLGGSVSPTYNYRTLSHYDTNSYPAEQNTEKGIVTLAAAFDVNVKVHKNWTIESGVRYSRMGQEVTADVQKEQLYAMSKQENVSNVKNISLVNSLGSFETKDKSVNEPVRSIDYTLSEEISLLTSSASETTNMRISQYLDYIEVPLTIRYYLPLNGHIKLSLAGGVSTNWLIDNRAYLNNDGQQLSLGETAGISSMTLSSHAGIGMGVPLMGRLSLSVEPRINYFLSEINRDHSSGFRPYSLGFFTGLRYTLGK